MLLSKFKLWCDKIFIWGLLEICHDLSYKQQLKIFLLQKPCDNIQGNEEIILMEDSPDG